MPRPSDPRRFRLVAAAAALVLAPLIELAAIALAPTMSDDAAAQVAAASDHRGALIVSVVLELIGATLLIVAVLGLAAAVGRRFAVWANAGGILALVGLVVVVFTAGTTAITASMVTGDADRTQMVSLLDRFQSSAGGSIIGPLTITLTLGLLALSIGLVRARAVPRWAAAVIAAGSVVQLIGFASGTRAPALVGFALLFIGFARVARTLLAGGEAARTVPAEAVSVAG